MTDFEKWLDTTRIDLYEKQKGKSVKEITDGFKIDTRKYAKQYGLRIFDSRGKTFLNYPKVDKMF